MEEVKYDLGVMLYEYNFEEYTQATVQFVKMIGCILRSFKTLKVRLMMTLLKA